MSIFSRAWGWFGGGNANTQRKGSQITQPSVSAHEDSPYVGVDGALQVSTVWACVTLIVETISTLPLNVYKSDQNGNKELVDKTSRLYQVLHNRPNKRQVAIVFWSQMMLNRVLRGNSYARIIRDRNKEVVALWPLSADQMEVIITDSGSMIYAYTIDNETLIYTDKDILHIPGMGNGIVGMAPLDYMRSSVSLAISAQNHTTKTYRKNARRPGVLMSDQVLTPEQRVKIKENFGDIVSGKDKELYLLEAQFKFDPLGMSPADIQLLESRQFSVQDLARWFGVPSVLINDTSETTTLGSSAYEIIQAWYRLKVRPQLELIEQSIQENVLTPKQRSQGIEVEFDLDALRRASPKDRSEVNAKNVQNGLRTRNEARATDNLKPLPGGDVLTAQVNLAPLDMLGKLKSTGSVPPETVEQ